MGIATTRKPSIKPYLSCRECEYKISGYGQCKKGYDNFYYRKSKNNHCDKCQSEMKETKRNYMINEFIRSLKNH